jgi:hypothetical protein
MAEYFARSLGMVTKSHRFLDLKLRGRTLPVRPNAIEVCSRGLHPMSTVKTPKSKKRIFENLFLLSKKNGA